MDIKNLLYKGLGFENRKMVALEKKIKEYYSDETNINGCENEYHFLLKNPFNTRKNKCFVFHSEFVNNYCIDDVVVFYDKTYKMYYVIHNNIKMYMKKSFSKKQAKEYYLSLLIEQDEKSPHLYLDDELKNKKYRTVIDVGAAEGLFAIDIMDKAEHIILFEYDDEWIDALNKTFLEYNEKVDIRKAFVTDEDNQMKTTLDIQINSKCVDLLKMDVEGTEINVVKGARKLLHSNPQIICLICVYHRSDDEAEIKKLLPGYSFETRNGKMVFPERYSFKREGFKIISPKKQMVGPYFTNGVMKVFYEK